MNMIMMQGLDLHVEQKFSSFNEFNSRVSTGLGLTFVKQ